MTAPRRDREQRATPSSTPWRAAFPSSATCSSRSDGVPVVFHDDDLERLTGTQRPVGSRTAAEVTATPLLDSAAGDSAATASPSSWSRSPDARCCRSSSSGSRTHRWATRWREGSRGACRPIKGPVTVESSIPSSSSSSGASGSGARIGIITYRYDKPDWDGDLTEGQRTCAAAPAALAVDAVRLHLLPPEGPRSAGGPPLPQSRPAGDGVDSPDAGGGRPRGSRVRDQIVFEGFDPESA
jgi:hypothetical protein